MSNRSNRKKNKKFLGSLAIFIIAFSLILGITSCRKKEPETIKIGAILPLTGDLSSYGIDTRKAIELAVEQANLTIKNEKKFILIVEDSKGLPAQAVSAFNKLTDIDKVYAVLGPITSAEVLSISPIANNKKIPIISPSATSVEITNAGEYVFRTINADSVETEAFAKFVKENLKLTKIGIIALQAAGTISYANSFEKFFIKAGGIIAGKEIVSEGMSNYRSPIKKILQKNLEAIYIAGYSKEIGEIVKQIREVDKNIQLLSYQSAEDKRVVEIAGKYVDGMIFSSTTLPDKILGEAHEKFVKDFKSKYNKEPGVFAAEIYDACNICIKAIKQSRGDKVKFIEILKRTSNYYGASGEIDFDENGDVHKPISIYKYEGETPKFLQVVKIK